jgi:hypothetical protein
MVYVCVRLDDVVLNSIWATNLLSIEVLWMSILQSLSTFS